ncbi:MAG TPA: alpha/beta hydrolase [Xanthobacteraceae bacterium]|nr:alpha/beta hydrolase [Xanthobacteraceae bacterium]
MLKCKRDRLLAIAAVSVGVVVMSAPARAQGPLVLAKSSYFFVGGKLDPAVEGTAPVGQIYVEYMIPQRLRHRTPVVMVHGGSQTGTNFTGTPDGRESWAQFFVRRGYAVYVVDGVARGRAAHWSQLQGPVSNPNMERLTQRFVAPERYKLWPQAHLHTQWPGEGKPGDDAFDQFYYSQFPSIVNFTKQQEINPPAIIALLEKIGPSILVTHSQSGAFAWPVVDKRPDLVRANVAVEPNGPPVRELEFKGAPDWFSESTRDKAFGLGEVPITYDPPVTATSKLEFIRKEQADKPDLAHCWLQKEPARKLPNVAKVPTLIVMSEASYHAAYDHCTAAYLTQAGVKNTFVRLVDRGIKGNGHMMMLEKNNMAIAGVMAEWLDSVRDGVRPVRSAQR